MLGRVSTIPNDSPSAIASDEQEHTDTTPFTVDDLEDNDNTTHQQ